MQDPDIPQQVEEDTNGAVDGVRQDEARAAPWAANARSTRGSLPLPWITATAPIWARTAAAMATATGRDGPVFPPPTRWSIPSLCPPHEKMRLRASSLLSKTCSS